MGININTTTNTNTNTNTTSSSSSRIQGTTNRIRRHSSSSNPARMDDSDNEDILVEDAVEDSDNEDIVEGAVEDDPSLFERQLKQHGLELVEINGDGNCLFRAIALQVYGDVESHLDVRKRCMDFMVRRQY